SLRAADDKMQISVRDTGMGIDADALEHIFDRFYRTKEAVDVGIKGTGLGLAIARQMIEAQGGRLTVTSVVGKGSTFTMTVPAANARQQDLP
ncbi:MAG: sensor histidine kinase, partial [Nakamurella sp.]